MNGMFAMPRFRLVWSVTVILAAALFIVPAPAFGAQPTPVHLNFSESYQGNVCGISVDVTTKGQSTIRELFDEEGNFVLWRGTSAAMETYTADNGKSVIVRYANQEVYSDPPTIDEQENTITWVATITGMPVQVRTPHGPVLLREAGLISVAWTLDLDTEELLSYEILNLHGQHPEVDSDFKLFCEVIGAALA